MEVLEAIKTRKSTREFLDTKIPKEILDKILLAGMCAPSAKGERPWHFIIIDDPAVLNQIPSFHPFAEMCRYAPLAILVCGDLRAEKSEGNIPNDCAAASQNILLAAHGLDLGGVWTGVYPRKERMTGFQKLLNLPKEIIPFSLIVLGYPKKRETAKHVLEKTRIHHDKW